MPRGGRRDFPSKRSFNQRNGDDFPVKNDSKRNSETVLDSGGALPAIEKKKFTGRCRLFVGNLSPDTKEEEVRKLFGAHGEVSECFLSGKGFGFVRLDTRAHAEAAKEALDGYVLGHNNSRGIRIRFAVHGASIRLKELSPYVSNELLNQGFSMFGNVERAVHIVDEKGRPTGEGIIEFERKNSAMDALRRINEGVFLLTGCPKPIVAEPLEPRDEDDGLSERMIPHTNQFTREREQPPRFAVHGSFEHEFGSKWKDLYQMEKRSKEQLDLELREQRDRLESDVEFAHEDYETVMLREDLRRRQEELERLEASRRERMEMMRRREEERGGLGRRPFPPFQHAPPPFQNRVERDMEVLGNAPPQGLKGERFGNERERDRERQELERRIEMEREISIGLGPMGPIPVEGKRPPKRGDDNLVNGVEKLLQMFKGPPGEGQTPNDVPIQIEPTGVPAPDMLVGMGRPPKGGMAPQEGLLGPPPAQGDIFSGGSVPNPNMFHNQPFQRKRPRF